jgi:hypothetical protein
MNNLFKNNSRFASLAEEGKDIKDNNRIKKDDNKTKKEEKNSRFNFDDISEKDSNIFKTDKNDFGNQRQWEDRRNNRMEQRSDFGNKKSEVKIEKKKEPQVILTEEDFPSAISCSTSREVKKTHIMTFAERAAQNCTIGETIKFVPSKQIESKYETEYSEKQMAIDVLDALCDLHERETARQIERYGYDAWERMNKFEGWEEEEAYNQKLDDDYNKWLQREEEREIKEEEEREREEEYLANNDRFINYWKYN